eukprot:scaffold94753_cov33-Cyclotella_meneghiniana.AAC.1
MGLPVLSVAHKTSIGRRQVGFRTSIMDTADIAGGNKSKSSSSSLRTIQSEDNIAYYINDKKSSKHKRHKRPSLLR